MSAADDITFVSFKHADAAQLGPQLRAAALTNLLRLRQEMPLLAPRLVVSDWGAENFVAERGRAMQRNASSGYYAVKWGGVVKGMVAYRYDDLARGIWPAGDSRPIGPRLTAWLGRGGRLAWDLSQVMFLAASELGKVARDHRLTGWPWAVVPEDNEPTVNALCDRTNGFGGFVSNGKPRDFGQLLGDGYGGRRQLFVGRVPVEELDPVA